MVTISDIYKGVCSFLKTNTDVTLEDSDVEEPVIRPAFKVIINDVTTGLFSSAMREVEAKFDIVYYAKARDRPNPEILKIKQLLSELFLEPIELAERCSDYADILEFKRYNEGILKCTIKINLLTLFRNESGLSDMEELETEITMAGAEVNGIFNADAAGENDEE